jgi:NAD(P)-dependent dehydrogenase (short-subunit alcohol dehydrogenase family)
MGRLDGKVAIITGAASGIGRATSILFAREGARVAVVDQNSTGLRDTVRTISGDSGAAQSFGAYVGNEDQVKPSSTARWRPSAASISSMPMPGSAAVSFRSSSRPQITGCEFCRPI